jgi:hypothetical protein
MNFLLATIAVIGFLSAGICQESDESELRTWFSSTGKFSIAAKMTLSADDKFNADVLLVKEDGESVTVPYDRLNRESQLFAEAQRKAVRRRVKESLDAEKKGKLPMVDSDKAEPAACVELARPESGWDRRRKRLKQRLAQPSSRLALVGGRLG